MLSRRGNNRSQPCPRSGTLRTMQSEPTRCGSGSASACCYRGTSSTWYSSLRSTNTESALASALDWEAAVDRSLHNVRRGPQAKCTRVRYSITPVAPAASPQKAGVRI